MTQGYAIGLMTGTSVDGIDAAMVEITEREDAMFPAIRLVHSVFVPFSAAQREKVFQLFHPTASVYAMGQLHAEFGHWLAAAVNRVIEDTAIPREAVKVIGAHGQTIAHYPAQSPDEYGFTIQIGDPAILAAETGIGVVSQFRTMDMALGGQGAPLVPYFDFAVFRSASEPRVLLNIGGIANITLLPRAATIEDVIGFDTGPGNMVVDGVMERVSHGARHFDHHGDLARQGRVCVKLVNAWLLHPYFSRIPPKSTGREEFGRDYSTAIYHQMCQAGLTPADMLRTVTAFVAQSIAQAIVGVQSGPIVLIVTGGGSHNRTLMDELTNHVLLVRPWETSDAYGVPNDMKEAMAFAYLAWQFLYGRPTNVPRVTGASAPAVQGMWTPAKPGPLF